MQWPEKENKPFIVRGPTLGAIYCRGFADGFHGRPRVIQPSIRAQEAYKKGYEAALAIKKNPQRN